MSIPITITATVAAWTTHGYNMKDLISSVERGENIRAINAVQLYGSPDRKEFADCIRVGEADITLRLIPRDEQTKLAVQALQAQLAEERVKWHQRQEAILAEISTLSAITYDEATA